MSAFYGCLLLGYDDLDGDGTLKMDDSYLGDEIDDDEQVEMYYEDDSNQIEQFDGAEVYNLAASNGKLDRATPLRQVLPKKKRNRQSSSSNNNNNNGSRQVVGVGHSLSLYRQTPAKNFTPRKSLLFVSFILMVFLN